MKNQKKQKDGGEVVVEEWVSVNKYYPNLAQAVGYIADVELSREVTGNDSLTLQEYGTLANSFKVGNYAPVV